MVGEAQIYLSSKNGVESQRISIQIYNYDKDYQTNLSPFDLCESYHEEVKDKDDILRKMYIDLNFWLPNDILLKADKMSMDDVEDFVTEFCDYVEDKYDVRIEIINCDHIDVIINTINDNTKYRAAKCYKPPLQDRVFLYSKLLKTKRVKFVEDECDDLIEELSELVFDPKCAEAVYLDDGSYQIDCWDSNIYSESGYWNYIDV